MDHTLFMRSILVCVSSAPPGGTCTVTCVMPKASEPIQDQGGNIVNFLSAAKRGGIAFALCLGVCVVKWHL